MKGELESQIDPPLSVVTAARTAATLLASCGRQKQQHQNILRTWQPVIAPLEPEVGEKETQSDGSYTLLLHVG